MVRIASRRRGTALVLVDFIHAMVEDGGRKLAMESVKAARHAAKLKARARRSRVPVVYANDHFGNWCADFAAVVNECRRRGGASAELAELLAPDAQDYSILKPRHSAFYGTPLEFLLDELGATRLILAGIEADVCVMYTAQDAYMRKFSLWVPRNCIAARTTYRLQASLAFMQCNLKADTRAAGSIRLDAAFAGQR